MSAACCGLVLTFEDINPNKVYIYLVVTYVAHYCSSMAYLSQ